MSDTEIAVVVFFFCVGGLIGGFLGYFAGWYSCAEAAQEELEIVLDQHAQDLRDSGAI